MKKLDDIVRVKHDHFGTLPQLFSRAIIKESGAFPQGDLSRGFGTIEVSERLAPQLTKYLMRAERACPTLLHALHYGRGEESECSRFMRKRQWPVLVETYQGRFPTGLSAPENAQPHEVALAVREKGWTPYRIWFDPEASVWIAKVIDWGQAA